MAIQQSINQLLSTASWGAALVAHQPDVAEARKEKRELGKLQTEMAEAEKFEAEHPIRPATVEEKQKYLSKHGLSPEAVEKAGNVDPYELAEIIDIYEAKTPGKSAQMYPAKSWNAMKARRRELDPAYREQMYQQEVGRQKTIEAMEGFLKGKIDLEEFKQKVGMTDGE